MQATATTCRTAYLSERRSGARDALLTTMASHVIEPQDIDDTKAGTPMYNIWMPIAFALLSVLLAALSIWRAV